VLLNSARMRLLNGAAELAAGEDGSYAAAAQRPKPLAGPVSSWWRVARWAVTPTLLRSGPYRFFFYSGDRSEPPHVHVERDDDEPKFWLRPVALAANWRFLGNGAPQGESYSCREPDCSTRELE